MIPNSSVDTIETIDITDPQYQRSSKNKPDKTDKWSYPKIEDGWMHAHNSIRGEMCDIEEALNAFEGNFPDGFTAWAIEALKKVWCNHEIHIHSHHSNEDDIMTPYLKKRINLPEKLEDDHLDIIDKMNGIRKSVDDLKVGDPIDSVRAKFMSYKASMIPHLLEEENIALPLMRAYFVPKEIDAKVQKIILNQPKVEAGSFVYYQTPEHFRQSFMKQQKVPSLVWNLYFKPRYHYFIKNMIDPLNSLKNGVEPMKEVGCFSF